jgi:preprotein translocase subunit SecA
VRGIVDRINALEPEFEKLSDDGHHRQDGGTPPARANGESLDDLLPEAFANCREGPSAHWACAPSTCS